MLKPDIIFNDTSLRDAVLATRAAAQDSFERFVRTVGALIDDDICNAILRSSCCLQDVALPLEGGDAWNAAEWFEDYTVDYDLRGLALALDTKIPVEEGLVLDEIAEDQLASCRYRIPRDGADCFAAGFCACTGDVLTSILTSPVWDTHHLEVFVDQEASDTRSVFVDHASKEKHSELLKRVFSSRQFASVETAADFNAAKEQLFPSLHFSPDIEAQVLRLTKHHLTNALEKLAKMNQTAADWATRGTVAPEYQFQWSGESQRTMDVEEYRNARKFRMPNGDSEIFENHLYVSGRHRIHFIEDRAARDFIIGYIGDHLPTVRFPH